MWSLYSEDDFPGLCSWTVSEACHGTIPPRGVGGKALGPCEVGPHMGLYLAPEGVAVRGEWTSAAPQQPALVETPVFQTGLATRMAALLCGTARDMCQRLISLRFGARVH